MEFSTGSFRWSSCLEETVSLCRSIFGRERHRHACGVTSTTPVADFWPVRRGAIAWLRYMNVFCTQSKGSNIPKVINLDKRRQRNLVNIITPDKSMPKMWHSSVLYKLSPSAFCISSWSSTCPLQIDWLRKCVLWISCIKPECGTMQVSRNLGA